MAGPRPTTKLLCITPISTTGMTEDLCRLYPSTSELDIVFIDGRNLNDCPPCIENHEQAVASTTAVLPRAIEYINSNKIDGVLVCCFSDHPLVYALQELLDVPVTGIFQAALQEATKDGEKFGIVTTAEAWEEILKKSVIDLGYAKQSAGVLSTGLGVLELKSLERSIVVDRIATFSKTLIENGATNIILGCAGMADLEEDIRSALPQTVTTIDGVRAGIEMLSDLARRTSDFGDSKRAKDTKRNCAVQSEELASPLRTIF